MSDCPTSNLGQYLLCLIDLPADACPLMLASTSMLLLCWCPHGLPKVSSPSLAFLLDVSKVLLNNEQQGTTAQILSRQLLLHTPAQTSLKCHSLLSYTETGSTGRTGS